LLEGSDRDCVAKAVSELLVKLNAEPTSRRSERLTTRASSPHLLTSLM
jgi:hypothetical protein